MVEKDTKMHEERNGQDRKNRIPVIGLTGGIGTGKSTVAEYLKKVNYAHVDADQIGRDLTADDSELLPVLDQVFGPAGELGEPGKPILREDGSLDRKALGAIAFSAQEKKEKLDEIIEVLPGMKSPTITPLANDEWVSVQSVIAEKHFWEIIGKLKSLGAEGILVLPIEKMIV